MGVAGMGFNFLPSNRTANSNHGYCADQDLYKHSSSGRTKITNELMFSFIACRQVLNCE